MGRKIVHWYSTKVGLWKRNGQTFNARICACINKLLPTPTPPHKLQDSPYPWTQPIHEKKSDAIREITSGIIGLKESKTTPEKCWKFLYYDKAIYPTMLMALKKMAVVQTNPTTKTAKRITQFLNYSATHPGTVT